MDTTQDQASAKGHFPVAKTLQGDSGSLPEDRSNLNSPSEVQKLPPLKGIVLQLQCLGPSFHLTCSLGRVPWDVPHFKQASNTLEGDPVLFCRANAPAGAPGPWSRGKNHFPFLCISKFRLA